MAGFVHCVNFQAPTNYLATGGGAADASFPHSYAQELLRAHKPWKSSSNVASGTTFYGVDFGSAVQLQGVGIDNANIQSIKIQAASDNAFSTNLITADYTITENLVERGLFVDNKGLPRGRFKLFADLRGTSFDGGGSARRYWRILADTSTTIDGSAGKMFLGSVAWCAACTTWSSGTSRYGEQPLEATRLNDDYAGGGATPVILGNGGSAISLAAAPGDHATMRTPLLEILRQCGVGRPFLFYRNAGDTADFYIATRTGDVTINTTAPTLIEFEQFIMRGAV